jgi:tRNA threonylcarbamoyladenosine modification (KEOPS) complex Cgi121 subunit
VHYSNPEFSIRTQLGIVAAEVFTLNRQFTNLGSVCVFVTEVNSGIFAEHKATIRCWQSGTNIAKTIKATPLVYASFVKFKKVNSSGEDIHGGK